MELLREVLNTKYLTRDYVEDLEYLFGHVIQGRMCTEDIYAQGVKDAINRAVTEKHLALDLADCRFVSRVSETLFVYARRYPDLITLCDTEDQERNRFIETMLFESQHKNVAQEKLPPKPARIEDFVEWAERLNPDIIYDAHAYNEHPEFLLFLQLLRPDVKLMSSYRKMFEYARVVFTPVMLYECTEFLYLPSVVDEFWDTHVDEKGNVHVVNLGDLPLMEFIAKYPCMPAEIGQKQFVAATASDAWRDSVKRVLLDVQTFLMDKPITIATYFPEEFHDN